MWRIGVLVLATVLLQYTLADIKNGFDNLLIQRLKRSPHYDSCETDYPPPPPPPPPFWPHHHQFWPPPPPPPPPPPSPPQQQPARYETDANANSESKANGFNNENSGGLCTTCGDNGSSAVSNAQSETGQAIAIAISKGNNG